MTASAQPTTQKPSDPASPVSKEPEAVRRKRGSFNSPNLRLATVEIPGYKQYWFSNTPGRIELALQNGYEFVEKTEAQINNRDMLGSDSAASGNTDMGTRVSVASGSEIGPDNQPVRMYLMKIREQWYREDQEERYGEGSRLDNVRKSLLGLAAPMGGEKMSDSDRAQMYVDTKRTKVPEFLKRKPF